MIKKTRAHANATKLTGSLKTCREGVMLICDFDIRVHRFQRINRKNLCSFNE